MSRKKTPEEYLKECKEKGYDLPVEDYVNATTKIKHKCINGHVYSQLPNNHLKGQKCPYCTKRIFKNIDELNEYLSSIGSDLCINNKYSGTSIKYDFLCKIHGVYSQRLSAHISGQGCPICGIKKTIKNRKQGYNIKNNKNYYTYCKFHKLDLPIEKYKGNTIPIKYKCSKCGNVYKQKPSNHYNMFSCKKCKKHIHSKGEKYIDCYLCNHNINYIPQKTFHDLKDKKLLSYDFYLPDYNILIEYQGIQHYEPRFGDSNYFEIQKLHDKLKREYAKNNGYKLLELKYTLDSQDKVNAYLDSKLYINYER